MHGTCISVVNRAVLLRGEPGSGKSDLALRVITEFSPGPDKRDVCLVSDDQVRLTLQDGTVLAGPPDTIAGKMEVRGIGIVEMPYVDDVPLLLIADLVPAKDVPRLPPVPLPREEILGVHIPVLKLAPYESSAAAKLKLALDSLS